VTGGCTSEGKVIGVTTCYTPCLGHAVSFSVDAYGLDDGAVIYLNGNNVKEQKITTNQVDVRQTISLSNYACKGGDVISINVWDGWATKWAIGGGTVTVHYEYTDRDGNTHKYDKTYTISAQNGTSSGQVAPCNTNWDKDSGKTVCDGGGCWDCGGDGTWQGGEYWKSPQLNDYYSVFEQTVADVIL
jgi:hypothetical protein